MTVLALTPFLLIGLLGSVHCAGMCGGIVAAFSMTARGRSQFPVRVVLAAPRVAALAGGATALAARSHAALRAASHAAQPARSHAALLNALGYNAGRIASYALAGALAGGLAQGARSLAGVAAVQMLAYWLANGLLIALGLYLSGAWRGLNALESLGSGIWRRIQPLTRWLLPLDSPAKAMALGALWGWLPCGMVYSVLLTAMLSGSALAGASIMAAFGLGTLPMLLTLGMFGARVKSAMQQGAVRIACGTIVAGFGVLGLLRAAHGLPASWLDAVCLVAAHGAMH